MELFSSPRLFNSFVSALKTVTPVIARFTRPGFGVTVKVASSLVTCLAPALRITRNLAPLSQVVSGEKEEVGEFAPGMSTPSRCHW
jgi:hypothetical protein